MKAAGGVDIVDRHGEDQLPREAAEPASEPAQGVFAPRADDVVAVIDGREQGVEVRGGPRCARRGDEDERCAGPGEPAVERTIPAALGTGDDDAIDRVAPLGQERFERVEYLPGGVVRGSGQHDHSDGSGRQRIAPEVSLERIEEVGSGCRHEASRRCARAQTGCGANQRSTAARYAS
jgi:hypothetical protein